MVWQDAFLADAQNVAPTGSNPVNLQSHRWLVVFRPSPLKNDGLRKSWDDEIPFPTVSGKSYIKFHGSSHHQPVYYPMGLSPIN